MINKSGRIVAAEPNQRLSRCRCHDAVVTMSSSRCRCHDVADRRQSIRSVLVSSTTGNVYFLEEDGSLNYVVKQHRLFKSIYTLMQKDDDDGDDNKDDKDDNDYDKDDDDDDDKDKNKDEMMTQ